VDSLLGSVVHARAICGLILGDLGYAAAASAQVEGAAAEEETASQDAMATPAELEELVGPLALYPDELLAIVLPASTYPLQIVQASRYLEKHEANPELKPDEEWDSKVEKAGNLQSDDKGKIVNTTEDDKQIIVIESTSTEAALGPGEPSIDPFAS